MKLQWKSVSEEQEKRNSRLRDYRSLIGKLRFRNGPNRTNVHILTIQLLKECKLLSKLYEEALKADILLS